MDLCLRRKLSGVLFALALCIAVWPCVLFASPPTENTSSLNAAVLFTDVAPDAPYTESVQALSSAGIVKGYPDGTFRPDQTITAAEFSILLSRTHLKSSGRVSPRAASSLCSDACITLPQAVSTLLLEMGVSHKLSSVCLPLLPAALHASIQGVEGEAYLTAAYYLDILDDSALLSLDQSACLTRSEAVSLLYGAMAVQNLTLPLPTHMHGIPVHFQGEKAASFVYDVAAGLSTFTKEVLGSYAASGAEITITDETSDQYYRSNVDIHGMYWPGNSDIILFSNGRRSSLFYALTGTIRHEMGHYIYAELLSAADQTAIQKAFQSREALCFAEASLQDKAENASEYFAELIAYLALHGRTSDCDDFAASTEIALKYFAVTQ